MNQKITAQEIWDKICLSDLYEGRNVYSLELPDGRVFEMDYELEINGYNVFDYYSSDGLGDFRGSVNFYIDDWRGYDKDGNEIEVENITWLLDKIKLAL